MRPMPSRKQVRRAFTGFALTLGVFGLICTGLLAANTGIFAASEAAAFGWPGDEPTLLLAGPALSSPSAVLTPDLVTVASLAVALSLIAVFNLAFVRHLSQAYAAPRRKRRVNT